jgi:hypothetical protein
VIAVSAADVSASGPFDVRRCPYCASTAIRAFTREKLARRVERVLLECGQCGTVRGLVAPRRVVRALERGRRRERSRLRQLCLVVSWLAADDADDDVPARRGTSQA